ncbi:hypothetical protein PSP6_130006 [Paraburkholderia tropica]|nr:hypothetical protein PSP6_130006 [Paraburkholderia tropica]
MRPIRGLIPLCFHDGREIGGLKRRGVRTGNRAFAHGLTQDVSRVPVKEFELPRIRCMRRQAENSLERPAWEMKTLKSANHANLKHDPVTVVRDCSPNQRTAHNLPPFGYKPDSTFVAQ